MNMNSSSTASFEPYPQSPILKKSNRGRKTLAVKEGYVDPTGLTHVMTVRRSLPPNPRKPKKRSIKKVNKPQKCKSCDYDDKFINLLTERIVNLENLVQKISDIAVTQSPPVMLNFNAMETDDLIELSNHLGILSPDLQNNEYASTNEIVQNQPVSSQFVATPLTSPLSDCSDFFPVNLNSGFNQF
ncbi:5084_t:CDS:1 [Cetraspora pellucida]|uniref:5084_t:CDS:1 n=1 Tax=Cetraspora pellucida TaxID=1433469 RepID=A0A9N9C191_9GLOM|nr:5084_t:CDS:1 [Cetraspora pellucida]